MIIVEDRTRDLPTCLAPVYDEMVTVAGCWADDELDPFDIGYQCDALATTDLGLCTYHHDQIVPMEATP